MAGRRPDSAGGRESALRTSTPVRLMAVVSVVAAALALLLPGVASAQTYSNPTPIVIPGPPPPAGCPTDPPPNNSCPSTPAAPYPSPIRVEGLTGGFFAYHIKVILRGLTHNSPADLDVMLQLPEGEYRTMLMSDVCAADTAQNPITQPIDLTFELSTTTAPFIPADTPCTTGTYRPFDDEDDPEFPYTGPDNFPSPAPPPPPPPCTSVDPPCPPVPPSPSPSRADGTWNLWVVDDTPGTQGVNSGQFAGGWSLEFTPRPPDPTLSISDATVTEGDSGTTPAVFTVTLENPPASAVTVDYATSSSSALAGEDFLPAAGTLTFAPGEQTKTITVNVVGDTVVEENEFFVVDLFNAQGAPLVDNEGLGTILDDDGPNAPTAPSLSISDVTVTEGDSGTVPAAFTVTMDRPADEVVTFDYATADGSAVAGADYTPATGRAEIPPGGTTITIPVDVAGDTVVEPTETFTVTLTNAQGASLTRPQGTGTIIDDDEGAVPSPDEDPDPVAAPAADPVPLAPQAATAACDPNYPGVCIPPFPPDLNCGDIALRDFSVPGSDPHRFDGDNDRIGCESTDFPLSPSGGGGGPAAQAGTSAGGGRSGTLARTGGYITDSATAGLIAVLMGLGLVFSFRRHRSERVSR